MTDDVILSEFFGMTDTEMHGYYACVYLSKWRTEDKQKPFVKFRKPGAASWVIAVDSEREGERVAENFVLGY